MATGWADIVSRAKGKRSKHNAESKEDSTRGSLRSSPRSQEDDQPSPEDPHDLVSRFIWTHQQHFDEALAELNRGQKRSCWMWYIFPTPPFIVNGQERGSWTNIRYSLRTDDQAKAYLNFVHEGVNLRKNYYDATAAIVRYLEKGRTVRQIVGIADEPKLKSSWEYFEQMTRDELDQGLHDLIAKGLALITSPRHKTEAKESNQKHLAKSTFSASFDDEDSVSVPSGVNSNEFPSEILRSSSELSNAESLGELSTVGMADDISSTRGGPVFVGKNNEDDAIDTIQKLTDANVVAPSGMLCEKEDSMI